MKFWSMSVLLPMLVITSIVFAMPQQLVDEPRNGEVLASFTTEPNHPDINEIFSLVNQQRIINGLEPLVPNAELTKVAKQRADDMKQNNYYAHKSPEGKFFYDLSESLQNKYVYSCENLDLQFKIGSHFYVQDWLSSAPHKKCMLNKSVTEAGYAVVELPNASKGVDIPSFVVVAIHASN